MGLFLARARQVSRTCEAKDGDHLSNTTLVRVALFRLQNGCCCAVIELQSPRLTIGIRQGEAGYQCLQGMGGPADVGRTDETFAGWIFWRASYVNVVAFALPELRKHAAKDATVKSDVAASSVSDSLP